MSQSACPITRGLASCVISGLWPRRFDEKRSSLVICLTKHNRRSISFHPPRYEPEDVPSAQGSTRSDEGLPKDDLFDDGSLQSNNSKGRSNNANGLAIELVPAALEVEAPPVPVKAKKGKKEKAG